MREYFSVRHGQKLMPFSFEFRPDGVVVLDDAVVDDRNFVFAVYVGMGVYVVRNSVCRPSGVCDTGGYVLLYGRNRHSQLPNFSGFFEHGQCIIRKQGNPGRIITAIFKPLQSVKQDRQWVLIANVPYYSAHIFLLYLSNYSDNTHHAPGCFPVAAMRMVRFRLMD